jgi:hypothetical protein
MAQWAASRRDLFPVILCERLGQLHSHGKPHSIEHTKSIIEDVFQRKFEDVFEEFDETPIGTGAIAQVRQFLASKLPSWTEHMTQGLPSNPQKRSNPTFFSRSKTS